ncbi:MAG: flippase-like domain-containing protein, partial [Erysipelotrichia bacterium]|nr:flippase-like domain-containing protein [Erysipelotrichia bacterium]
VPLHHSASVLWMDFIIYQTTMVMSVLILILLRFDHFYRTYSQFFIIVLLGFLVNSVVIIGLWALVRFPGFYMWLTTRGFSIGVKMHLIKDPERTRITMDEQLRRFGDEIVIMRTHRELIPKVVLAHFLRLMLYYSIPFLCAKALNISVGLDQMIDILALSSFVAMINAFIPLPGSSGGTEATFLLMFSTIFGKTNAGTIMLLWRIMTYYFVLLIGFAAFIYVKKVPQVEIEDDSNIPQPLPPDPDAPALRKKRKDAHPGDEDKGREKRL